MSDYPIVNNEITSKLRSEIRKKLDELGRSSDDELPEYIMVMIANQRTKFQIKDDLSLFLGRDCISFVDWLLDRMEVLKSEENKNKTTAASSSTAINQQQQQQPISSSTSQDDSKSSSTGQEKRDKNDVGVELILDEEMDLDLVGDEDKLNTSSPGGDDENGILEDDCSEDDNGYGEGGKVQERCKYWPSCTTGDDCPYHHPATPCRAFPNCRFGDKCLYIHPTCKFDPGCTRRGCPFAHSGGARRMDSKPPYWAATAPSTATIAKCKFGLSCLNPKCPFIHPRAEPCRFGSNCLLDTCPFRHPNDELKKPQHSAYKWTAQS